MQLGSQLVLIAASMLAGWLMIESGLFKHLLERRHDRRPCPSCGRDTNTCGCF
jgi:hypothetical protein